MKLSEAKPAEAPNVNLLRFLKASKGEEKKIKRMIKTSMENFFGRTPGELLNGIALEFHLKWSTIRKTTNL